MSCRGLIAAVATVAAILSGGAGAGLATPHSRQEPDLAAYDRGVAAAVRSDLGASARLPRRRPGLRLRGHARGQRPGHLRPVPLPGRLSARLGRDPATRHGHVRDAVVRRHRMPLRMAVGARLAGWQLLLDGRARRGRHQPVRHRGTHQPAGAVEGEYTARFTVGAGDALTYQGITALTGAADDSQWGSATPGPATAGGG
jgi:hypothetical protein